jgi:hypothetical protein
MAKLGSDAGHPFYNLTLANVDSLRAWLKAESGPESGARTIA